MNEYGNKLLLAILEDNLQANNNSLFHLSNEIEILQKRIANINKNNEIIEKQIKSLKSVPWHEAIQAWVDGKTISYILNGTEFEISGNSLFLGQYREGGYHLRGLSKEEIDKCKWFIKP